MPPLAALYLDLLKRSLLDTRHHNHAGTGQQPEPDRPPQLDPASQYFSEHALPTPRRRCLDMLHTCLENCLEAGILGDFVAWGGWHSGTAVLMRGVLAAYQNDSRTVWVVNAFGESPARAASTDDDAQTSSNLAMQPALNLAAAMAHFSYYGLLDSQVRFLLGWLADLPPRASMTQVATLLLDSHLGYKNSLIALDTIYPYLATGGYVVVNTWDAHSNRGESQASLDFRRTHAITDGLMIVDAYCAYWRKGTHP